MSDHRCPDHDGPDADLPRAPRRVLVLSADMGGGHNATAAALEESVLQVWPSSEIQRLDSLDVMGRGVGPLFRAVYVANVQDTPWLYEFFYAALWRHRAFAAASKRVTGSWCGRRLAPAIDRFDPDLILSTYPLGSSGLDWLIRHRGLAVPTGCWISDFAAHPFWVYRDVGINFVMDSSAIPSARCAEPRARLATSALPVVRGFRPSDREVARVRLGLRPDAYIPLVACGSYAFGDIGSLVSTLAAASNQVQVVAACGRNAVVRKDLAALGLPGDRLRVLGWTDDMPAVVQAADVVVGNAGGATALEALATGVPIILTRPIAAHGSANAELMTVAGVADLCLDEAALAAYVRAAVAQLGAPGRSANGGSAQRGSRPNGSMSSGPGERAEAGSEGAQLVQTRLTGLNRNLLMLAGGAPAIPGDGAPIEPPDGTAPGARPGSAGTPGRGFTTSPRQQRGWPMRPSDAFFAHVESPSAPQELGVVLDLGPTSSGRPAALADIWSSMQTRSALPSMRRVLHRSTLDWELCSAVDVREHIDEQVLSPASLAAQAWSAVGDFWSGTMPAGRPAWRMRLIHGGGRALFAIKMHHCQGDGISALGLLDRLLDAAPDDPLVERRSADLGGRDGFNPAAVVRGIAHLAGRGFAPRHPLTDVNQSAGREVVGVPLQWTDIRRTASRLGAAPIDVVLAVAGDALRRVLAPSGLLTPGLPLRAMVPVAMRPARLDREFGNWTGSLVIDLPMQQMPLAQRVAHAGRELALRTGNGEAVGAAAVMRLAGSLPTPVHRMFARAVYNRRFFNTTISYMPGAKRSRWLVGSPVRAMYPVLPLAPGVPVTIGAIVASGCVGIAILLDKGLGLDRATVERSLLDAISPIAARRADRDAEVVLG